MSIWATLLCIDGEANLEGEERKPIRYKENHRPDDDDRAGYLLLNTIPDYVYDDEGEGKYLPYLALHVAEKDIYVMKDNSEVADIILDRRQVETLRDVLNSWLKWQAKQ